MRYITLLILAFACYTHSFSQVILYENHFESPKSTPTANCAPDFDNTPVNTLWGGTGTGTGGDGNFTQTFTVETILINGPANQYLDPSLKGGNYAIGMLSTGRDDRLALTLNSQGYPYINITFDLSAIGINGCGFGNTSISTPRMNIKLYNTPSGLFYFSNPGTLLDEKNITGISAASNRYTFNWASVGTSLTNTASGFITVVLDPTSGNYMAFDTLQITSANATLPLQLISFTAHELNNNIHLNWQTSNEVDFENFEIEESDNGTSFTTIDVVQAKFSSTQNNYLYKSNAVWHSNKKYYRLKMIDKDASFSYSNTIVVYKVKSSLKVSPNPVKNLLYLSNLREAGHVYMSSTEGRIVLKKDVSPANHIIDMSTLSPGLYVLQYRSKHEVSVFKIMKR